MSPRPFLKWAGGKSRLLVQYEPYLPTRWDTYYEPFLGGGALFFHLAQRYPQRRYVLSDLNADLVTTYRVVRDDVEALIERLLEHQVRHTAEYYYALRSARPQEAVEQAAWFIYLNKTCFNGLYRLNRRGEFNVPLGRYRQPLICDAANLRAASRVLQGVELRVASFEWVLEAAQAGDFVYFDPPYWPLSATANFVAYTDRGFGEPEQRRLRDVFAALAQRGVQALLSNSDCEPVRQLYAPYRLHAIRAPRAINCRAAARGAVAELLVQS